MSDEDNKYSHVIWVPAEKRDAVESKVKQLQNKAQKLGLPEPRLSFTGNEKIFDVPVRYEDGDGPSGSIKMLKQEAVYSGAIPRINGHQFIAMIQHEKGDDGTYNNLVVTPNKSSQEVVEKLDQDMHVCTPNCDHCQQPRARKNTFLVAPKSTPEEIIQVGSTCVDDYTGTQSLKQVMGAFDINMIFIQETYLDDLVRELTTSNNPARFFPVDSYVAIAKTVTDRNGFQRSDEKFSTRDSIIAYIHDPSSAPIDIQQIVYQAFNDDKKGKVYDQSEQIKQWVSEQPNSNYFSNAKSLFKRDYIDLKNRAGTGILASIPNTYQSALLREKYSQKSNSDKAMLNEPFGVAKQRGPLKLTLLTVKEKTNQQFPTVSYGFSDDNGRRFSWNASWPGNSDLKSGETYVLNATIKGHSEFKDTHYTFLTRCADIQKVESSEPVPDFQKGSQKRTFKETFSFTHSIHDEDNKITGDGFVLIKRQWRENRKVRDFSYAIPIPVHERFAEQIISTMADWTGVSRGWGDDLDLDNKADKDFIKALYKEISPFTDAPSPEDGIVYVVEDAFTPVFEHSVASKFSKPNCPSNEISKRKPAIFKSEATAISHAQGLPGSRLMKVKMIDWNPVIVPEEVRRGDINDLNQLKEQASEQMYNVIIYRRSDGKSKAEPLSWNAGMIGNSIEILKQEGVFQNINQIDSRALNGRKFTTIVGLDSPEKIEKLKSSLSTPQTIPLFTDNNLLPPILTPTDTNKGGQKGNVTMYSLVTDDFMVASSTKTRLIVPTDNVTSQYLEKMGADVIVLDANESRYQQSIDGAIPIDVNTENVAEKIVELTNEVVLDPNRDFSRRASIKR